MTPPALAVYGAVTGLLQPLAPALLHRRAARGKEDPARLHERLGRPTLPRPPGPLAWLHGASVGESLSLLPLIDRLRAERPDVSLLVTSVTVTAAELLAHRLPSGVLHQYAPLDMPSASAGFLTHWRPDLAVIVESELWPGLLRRARARGVRLALVSARLSEESARGWARAPESARSVLGNFELVLAQDDATAERFVRLGGRDDGRLNLKRVGQPLPVVDVELGQARAATWGRSVLLAASTHPGEDRLVLDAFAALEDKGAVLVIAPRHPARGLEVAELAAELGVAVGLRSRGEPVGATPVYVADTLGELGLWMRLAKAVFVGGGSATGVGGHNPLEPARLDRPLASGPHVDNWREVYADLHRAGAVAWIRTPADLARFWTASLDDDPALVEAASLAKAIARRDTGALDAAVGQLLALLP